MIYQYSNNRRLIISNKNDVHPVLFNGVVPCVVLLTAWNLEGASLESWAGIIRLFLERGCTYFVCAGEYSETLHDAIDDFLYQYDDEFGVEKSKDIVTTYHVNESVEDVVNFFVRSTEIRDKNNGYLVAVLDEGVIFDAEIIRCLTRKAELSFRVPPHVGTGHPI